ncbi:MAG: hypothetical protein WCB48_02900 [Casimicrobiaceae bacterium]
MAAFIHRHGHNGCLEASGRVTDLGQTATVWQKPLIGQLQPIMAQETQFGNDRSQGAAAGARRGKRGEESGNVIIDRRSKMADTECRQHTLACQVIQSCVA